MSCYSEEEIHQPTEENPAEYITNVPHMDTSPSIFKKSEESETNFYQQTNKTSVKKSTNNMKLICYRNGLCLVKEIRTAKIKEGFNSIIFENLLDGLIPQTLRFIPINNKRVNVLNYKFQKNEISKENFLKNSIGKNITFLISANSEPKQGKLLSLIKEDGVPHAIVDSDKKYILPISQCIGFEKSQKLENNFGNRAVITLESSVNEEIKFEISYLTPNILWQHFFSVDVVDDMSNINLISQAALLNNSNQDLEDIDVTFNTTTPNFAKTSSRADFLSSSNDHENLTYTNTLSVPKKSPVTSTLMSANGIQPRREYTVKIPSEIFEKPFANKINISTKNLMVIDNPQTVGLNHNFRNSDLFLFSVKNGERNFMCRRTVSSFKRDNEFVFELDNTSDIITTVNQTDYRKLADNQFDCGLCVFLKNNTKSEAIVSVSLEVGSFWDITKTNIEMQKNKNTPMWKIKLPAQEQKELHFRIKMSRPMKLVVFPDKRLSKKCTDVPMGDPKAAAILDEMAKKMIEWNGMGLAAPQVGISQKYVVLYDPQNPEVIYKMINPQITKKSDTLVESTEGCLSLPGMNATVLRHDAVSVEYFDETFTKKTLDLEGILAICVQHETDHLYGKLYIDRLPSKERAEFVKNFKKLQEGMQEQQQ